MGPLRLVDTDPPDLPGPGWERIRPRLSGICGSDLATVDGRSTRYFDPIVSFPFVPGHEVVADRDDGTRVVIEPVLGCVARGIDPPLRRVRTRRPRQLRAHRVRAPRARPATGFCCDTGGGWSTFMVAHESQLHAVPDEMSDEAAVMVEPTACAVHAVVRERRTRRRSSRCSARARSAARRRRRCARHTRHRARSSSAPSTRNSGALAADLGADLVVEPDELARARAPCDRARWPSASAAHRRRRHRPRLRRQRGLARRRRSRSSGPAATWSLVGMPGSVQARPHDPVAPRDQARRRVRLRHRDAARRHPAAHVRPGLRPGARRPASSRLVSATYPLVALRATPSSTPPPPAGAAA